MPKLIREIRMGPPKVWKTGAVVSSYPRPLFVFEGDEGGLDVINEPIEWVTKATFPVYLTAGKIAPITAFQFAKHPDLQLVDLFGPIPEKTSFPEFNELGNMLFKAKPFPFKTVVIDPIGMLSNSILSYFSQTNARKMEDARKWASAVGDKTKNVMAAFFTLPCHVVCLMHSAKQQVVNEKGEVTSSTEEPALLSKTARTMIGSIASQFFYQNCLVIGTNRVVKLHTVGDSHVQGLGARWPANLPAEITNPTFDAVYGEAVKKGETTK